MTLIGKLISLFIGSLNTWVCSDCALQTHVCPLMFPRRGGMKWPASKKPSKKTSKKQKKRPKSVMAKETLVSETCGRNAWGKWRETSGKGPVLVFSFGSRPWRPWVQHQLPSGSRRAMIHNMCGVNCGLIYSGWWFGTFFIFPYIGNFIIPTDELHHFSEGLVYHQPVLVYQAGHRSDCFR